MKASVIHTRLVCIVLILLFAKSGFAQPQGKVVINEYMPWPSNTCGTTSEFIELMNFGPGPVDIGCHILTTGVYSVTIPKNTILKPGQYYVISGQDFIPGTCSNIDSTASGIHANLNWNTCNCTNKPIPKTGDGMMTDGGASNTPLVLLDPSLKVVDAVVRDLPTEPTVSVTSSAVSGGCTPKTFNIGSMGISYETLGMATGKQNSFARTLDGDCNWQKTPQQSGNATNNKPGNTTDISYDFDMVSPTSCADAPTGSVSIYVKHSNYTVVFPMSYIISLDVNNDGLFDFNDQYNTYVDNTAPFIEIDNLPVGHFKVTVYSKNGCYLKNFEFTIIPCDPALLPVRLVYFKNKGTTGNQHNLEWVLQEVQNLQSVVLESSSDGTTFLSEQVFTHGENRGTKVYAAQVSLASSSRYYRLKITGKDGRAFYSSVINTVSSGVPPQVRFWPNPATDRLYVEGITGTEQKPAYAIYNNTGFVVANGILKTAGEKGSIPLPASLPPGVYHLQFTDQQPISFRFVKH